MPDDFEADVAAVQSIDAVRSILDVVCSMTCMGFAAVARVTGSRWVALAVRDQINFGLKPGGELKVETTICYEIRDSGAPIVIDNTAEDKIYCHHPTPRMYGFRSYISVPIVRRNGLFYGTLCAIDPEPRTLNTPATLSMFRLFAELIAMQLESAEQLTNSRTQLAISRADLATSQANLLDARSTAQLREQFIAVLGHDLRNPLASIDAGVKLLSKREKDNERLGLLQMMQGSVLRMSSLIDDVLDFARGRLGGGLEIEHGTGKSLAPVLQQVISELRGSCPDRVIETQIDLNETVDCDPRRIGQMFSNLLGNALTYGATDKPVIVVASTHAGEFELSVSNAGNPIPAAAMERLFQPFYRGAVRNSGNGLGLGLYIAAEIARSHGGMLTATSTLEQTRFTFKMPLRRREQSAAHHHEH
jgi:signal transduction histidine kinase